MKNILFKSASKLGLFSYSQVFISEDFWEQFELSAFAVIP